MKSIQPQQISTAKEFLNSPFQNRECEKILYNIVLLQKEANPEQWTPFSWAEYQAFCTHRVSEAEKRVLDAFVNGGKPVTFTTCVLSPGWLAFDGENYSFTPKMIEMLGERYSIEAVAEN